MHKIYLVWQQDGGRIIANTIVSDSQPEGILTDEPQLTLDVILPVPPAGQRYVAVVDTGKGCVDSMEKAKAVAYLRLNALPKRYRCD